MSNQQHEALAEFDRRLNERRKGAFVTIDTKETDPLKQTVRAYLTVNLEGITPAPSDDDILVWCQERYYAYAHSVERHEDRPHDVDINVNRDVSQ